MKRLNVFINRHLAGELTQDRGGQLGFVYSENWLSRSDAIPLSKSLPLGTKKFIGQQTRPFFAGILPEEGQREQIAAIFGVSPQNDFALLERIGGECAGAITLLPPGIPLSEKQEPTFEALDDVELTKIIADLPRRPLMAGRGGLRLSLAGAQPKLPVSLRNGQICLPLGESASTHIIKPEPAHFRGLAYVEVLCMALAKEVGLSISNVEVIKIGTIDCLLIERYDRIVSDANIVTRIHQEDFCQALGFPPERKYQQEGGPLLRDCIRLIREWSTIPALDLRNFIDGLIFNTIICNADAHGKNYSFLYHAGTRRLAPFYDLVCTLVWPELSLVPAMKIGGSTSIKSISTRNWQKMASECEIGWPMLRDRIAFMKEKILEGLHSRAVQAITSANQTASAAAEIIAATAGGGTACGATYRA